MEYIYKFFRNNWAALLYVVFIFSTTTIGVLTIRQNKNKFIEPLTICVYSVKFKNSNINSISVYPFHGQCPFEIKESIFDAKFEGAMSINEEITNYPYRFFFHTKDYDFQYNSVLK